MTAAAPGGRREAPSTYHSHPGSETPVGCPNCRSTAGIELHGTTPTRWTVSAFRVPGVTDPDYDVDEVTVDEPEPTPTVVGKVSCSACGWAYSGPRPLALLVEVQP